MKKHLSCNKSETISFYGYVCATSLPLRKVASTYLTALIAKPTLERRHFGYYLVLTILSTDERSRCLGILLYKNLTGRITDKKPEQINTR